MTQVEWSLLVDGVTFVGIALVGRWRKAGWSVSMCAQLLKIGYGATFALPGFVGFSVLIFAVYAFHHWDHRAEPWSSVKSRQEPTAQVTGRHRV
jgi:hypothetical protein